MKDEELFKEVGRITNDMYKVARRIEKKKSISNRVSLDVYISDFNMAVSHVRENLKRLKGVG